MGLGAKLIEKHFVISKKRKGPDVICSMDKQELKELLFASESIHASLASNKDFINEENVTRRFAFHSVVSKSNIFKGQKFNKENLTTKKTRHRLFSCFKNLLTFWEKIKKKYKKKNRLIRKNDVQ